MAGKQTARILVVDDDPDLRDALAAVLGLAGHKVDKAEDGVAALELLGLQPPDLILLDMKMPTMDGWEFAREARARFGDALPPIVVLTAAENPAARAAEVGAQGWLGKPFDIDHLRREVARQLAKAK